MNSRVTNFIIVINLMAYIGVIGVVLMNLLSKYAESPYPCIPACTFGYHCVSYQTLGCSLYQEDCQKNYCEPHTQTVTNLMQSNDKPVSTLSN